MADDASKDEELKKLKSDNAELKRRLKAAEGVGQLNREAKNSVFLDMFSRKEYLIQLYRDLHPEDLNITEDDLRVVTIQNVLTDKPYNDLGFMAREKLLLLGEAQSIWSSNIIFRLWGYGFDSLMNHVMSVDLDIYAKANVVLPDVEAFVIHTGKDMIRDVEIGPNGEQYISLNKTFFHGESGKPEFRAKVIRMDNVNGILEEYLIFCRIFDEQRSAHKDDKEIAIKSILEECSKRGVLQQYLKEHRSEVERIMRGLLSQEKVAEMHERTERIKDAIQMGRALGGTDEQIRDQLVKQFHMSPRYAQNCVETDWEESGPIVV